MRGEAYSASDNSEENEKAAGIIPAAFCDLISNLPRTVCRPVLRQGPGLPEVSAHARARGAAAEDRKSVV